MGRDIAILGAGITGLVAGMKLSNENQVTVIEKNNFVGGMSTSFKYKHYTLDYGPHKIYTQLPNVMEEIKAICPLLRIKKKNSIYLKGNFFDFPLSMKQVGIRLPLVGVRAAVDIVLSKVKKEEDISYENYLKNRFGNTLYNLVFRDYAGKIWGDPKQLDAELAKRRVAVSGILELLKSMIFKDSEKISAEYFYYPVEGSIQLYEKISEKIKQEGDILTNSVINEITLKDSMVTSVKIKNKALKTDFLISTIPLKDLISLIKPTPPASVIGAADRLHYRDLNIIYFVLNNPHPIKDNWIFFPEKKFLFNRVSEQKSFSPNSVPADKSVLMVETTREIDRETLDKIKSQLMKLEFFKAEEVEEVFFKRLKQAYPIYSEGFNEDLKIILDYLDSIKNLITIGRHGLFNYNNIDQCWDMASKAVEYITKNQAKEDWKRVRKYFDSYKIVD